MRDHLNSNLDRDNHTNDNLSKHHPDDKPHVSHCYIDTHEHTDRDARTPTNDYTNHNHKPYHHAHHDHLFCRLQWLRSGRVSV